MNKNERLYYIDWLRVFAFGLLFVFHSARFFDDFPWHVKNEESSMLVNFFIGFCHGWRMHLIFFISGVGTFFAIRSRKNQFIKDRVKRLIIPYIVGIIILIPPQKFYESIFNGWFEGTQLQFALNYHNWLAHNPPGFTLQWTGHLGLHIWYLAFLFVMTMVFLPFLKSLTKHNRLSNFMEYLSNTEWGIFVFLIPIILVDTLLRPYFQNYLDWADFFLYGMFFLLGYLFMTQRGFIKVAKKYTYYFLGTGIIFSMYVLTHYPEIMERPNFILSLFRTSVICISTFSWVLFFFGLSQRKFNFSHKLLNSLNVGILPFYILHQTVIIITGYYIVALEISMFAKFLFIFFSSLLITISLYQIIRKINLLRFLFGMKPKKKKIEDAENKDLRLKPIFVTYTD